MGLIAVCFNFFVYVGLLGGSSCVGVDRSRILNIFCCSIRPTFSVMCGLSCLLFIVVLVSVSVLFLFFTTDIHTFIYFTLFLKGFFHLGGLVSRMHTSDYISFAEWECFCFSSFTEYNFGFMNFQCIL